MHKRRSNRTRGSVILLPGRGMLVLYALFVSLIVCSVIGTTSKVYKQEIQVNAKAETASEFLIVGPVTTTYTEELDHEKECVEQLEEYYPIQEKSERKVNGKYITVEERGMLARIIQAEAETEGLYGKALVMLVIINRCECEYEFPDTIAEVIFEPGQFSPVRPGCRYWTCTPDEECEQAIDLVLSGWDESMGALYFEGCRNPNNWHSRTLQFLFKHNGHRFYR